MTPTNFAIREGFDSHEARKKRLGQYFSGSAVSKLLVALAAHRPVMSMCDPMGGRGDMLTATCAVAPTCQRTDGIEIDPLAHAAGVTSLQDVTAESTYLLGSAFDAGAVLGLCKEGYDLVATNPPYVRYQSQKAGAGQSAKLPSALEVRNGLRQCLAGLTTLNADDRRDFTTLAESYSGLSDLAVPSWILCAALVKPGGTLAMVVPDAWLNRDYAAVVKYLLLRWFHIEFIVEDAHAAWFSDAQVKTTLLVARRIPSLDSISQWQDQTYLHVALPSNMANEDSLVGRAALSADTSPEIAFARQALNVADGTTDMLAGNATWHRVRIADQVAALSRVSRGEAWFKGFELHSSPSSTEQFMLPPVLAPWFAGYRKFTTLQQLGVEVGQGLRTGANPFFYVDVDARKKTLTTVSSSLFANETLRVPSACALPVVRKQADVGSALAVRADALKGAVLAFQGWALPEHAADSRARALGDDAADYIRRAAEAKVGDKVLTTLTAVAPNARKANARTGAPARFWYMLPDFAPRHRPDLFVARVNSETPRVVLNPGRQALVDANFSTLWLNEGARVTATAVFAFLNSSLAAALFEHTGSVMGGGALKLEATHLRSLPVPALTAKAWLRLDTLGSGLVATAPEDRQALVRRINEVLCRAMFGAAEFATKVAELHAVIRQKQAARSKNHDSSTRSTSPDLPD